MNQNIKYLSLLTLLIFSFTIFSCSTVENEINSFPLQVKDENIESKLVVLSDKWISLSIYNNTDNVITLITDLASYTYNNKTSRLIPEGTKYIDATRSQPNIAIPPKTNINKLWTNADSIQYKSNSKDSNWIINGWIPSDISQCVFVFGYNINNNN